MGSRQNIQGNEWANAGSITDPGGAKVDLGYIAEKPPFQTENFKSNRADEMLAHIEEFGMPEWDALTTYNINSYALGSDGLIYKSLQNANTNNDPTSPSPSWWAEAFADLTTAQTFTGEKTFDDLKLGANADADNNKITTLAAPTSNQDAANKAYVDAVAFGSYASGSLMGITWPLTVTTTVNNTDIASVQATTDGFLIVHYEITAGANCQGRVELYSDSANPPTNKRAHADGMEISGIFPSGSAIIPVKKGEYFKAEFVNKKATITVNSRTYNWMPSN